MGLFSNSVTRDELKRGDHIYSWRTGYVYAHHGIYVGDNKVIHFIRGPGQETRNGAVLDYFTWCCMRNQSQVPCPTCNQKDEADGVVISCLDCFLAGGDLNRFEYSVNTAVFLAKARGGTCTLASSDPDDLVVHRAIYLLMMGSGFGCYDVFKNNCEDFAIYCKTGLLVSDKGVIGRSGQALSIVGGLATVATIPLRLVTTNVFGMATAAGAYCISRYATDIGKRRNVIKMEVEDLAAKLAKDSTDEDKSTDGKTDGKRK